MSPFDDKEFRAVVGKVSDQHKADVWFINAPTYRQTYEELLREAPAKRLDNAYIVLVTLGGSPHVAYRMGRYFQRNYQRVTVCVPGPCVSGGTLLALAANELVISDNGVLGPLDIQLRKADELDEFMSGLTVTGSLDALRAEVRSMFSRTVLTLKEEFGSQITLRTAMETAANLTLGVFTPIFGQIDPMRLGEDTRSTRIISGYGERLLQKSDNLKKGKLEYLVTGYPSHGFEIDREEAAGLFKDVRNPDTNETLLVKVLGELATVTSDRKSVVINVTLEPSEDTKEKVDDGRTSDRGNPRRQREKAPAAD